MTIRDKVLRGLEICSQLNANNCGQCPYLDVVMKIKDMPVSMCETLLLRDAMVLLQADEREEDDRK